MGGLLRTNQQSEVSEQRRMPVDGVNSDAITDVSAETVQLYYFSSGVLTTDAGQAAGVIVVGKLANRNILGALGDVVGDFGDTSVSFTSTALTAIRPFDQIAVESAEAAAASSKLTLTAKATAATSGFQNGEYCIDHRTGTIYGVKASAQVTLTAAAYKVNIAVSGGGGGIASDVNVAKYGGTATTLGQKASAASMPVVFPSDQSLGATLIDPTHWSPNDGSVAYTSNVTITCAGFPFTVDDANCTVVAVYYKPTGGEWQSALVNGSGGVSLVAASNVITVAGAGTPFASADTYLVAIKEQVKSLTTATSSKRTEEVDPLDQKYVPDVLIDETNIPETTTAYAYIDMAGYRTVGIQGDTSGATPTDVLTVTLEATCQDDGTAAASCSYQDLTDALTGAASYADTDFFFLINTPFAVKYLRVKYTTSTGGGNDADLTVYSKRLY